MSELTKMKLAMQVLIMVTLFSSCGNYFERKNQGDSQTKPPAGVSKPGSGNGTTTEDQIVFAVVAEKIFVPYCIKCHQNYADYAAVKADVSKIIETVESNRMPKKSDPLTDDLKQLLRLWVQNGAPEMATPIVKEPQPPKPPALPTPTPQPAPPVSTPPQEEVLAPNWNSLSKKIFSARCTSCHSPDGEANFFDLTSRQKVLEQSDRQVGGKKFFNFEDVENSFFMAVIQNPDEPMPPKSTAFAPLTQEEISVLKNWIKLGLP